MIFIPLFDPSPEVGPGGGGYNGSAGGGATGSSLPWGVGEAAVRWVGVVGAAGGPYSASDPGRTACFLNGIRTVTTEAGPTRFQGSMLLNKFDYGCTTKGIVLTLRGAMVSL